MLQGRVHAFTDQQLASIITIGLALTCALLPCVTAGVESVDVDLASQKVTVKATTATTEAIIEKVTKTGKKTELWAA